MATDEDAGTEKRMLNFELALAKMAPGKTECQFPAYFDAWKMGLWNPAKPDELKSRTDCRADSTRNQIVSRQRVEDEIRQMVAGAAQHYSALAGRAGYLLYGPTETPYASTKPPVRKNFPKLKLREGAVTDWQGVLGQKIPRFENRILNDCALIPRLHVCRNPSRVEYKELPEEKLLPAQVTFLMKLKNMRVEEKTPQRKQRGLTAAQIKEIFEKYNPARKYSLTPTQWKRWCQEFDVVPDHRCERKGKRSERRSR